MRIFKFSTPIFWLTVALVTLCEILFIALTDRMTSAPLLPPTGDDAALVAKRTLMRKADGSIVLIGDSSCLFGLIPGIISDATGVPCVNLGTLLSFTMAGYETLLEETLETRKPAALVIAVNPRAFKPDAEEANAFGQIGRYLLAYGRSNEGYTPNFNDLERLIFRKHQLNTFPPEFGGAFPEFLRRLDSTGGYFPEFHAYRHRASDLETAFAPSGFTRGAFERMVRKADAKGIPVYFWWSPVPKDAASREYSDLVNAFTRELSSIKGLNILRDTLPTWDSSFFATVTHVNTLGARQNSQELGRLLSRKPSVTDERPLHPVQAGEGMGGVPGPVPIDFPNPATL